jgi:Carbohydrate esterase, sialic acid-specific acetylesterase
MGMIMINIDCDSIDYNCQQVVEIDNEKISIIDQEQQHRNPTGTVADIEKLKLVHQHQHMYQFDHEEQQCFNILPKFIERNQLLFRSSCKTRRRRDDMVLVTNMAFQRRYFYRYPIKMYFEIIHVVFLLLCFNNVNASIYSFFHRHKRPTVRVVILAGEGNIEGFASITHLTDLINQEFTKTQQEQEQERQQQSSKNNSGTDKEKGKITTDDNIDYSNESNRNQFGPYSHLVDTYDKTTGRVINWTIFDNVYVTYEHHHTASTTSTSGSTDTATTTAATGASGTARTTGKTRSTSTTIQAPDVLLHDRLSIMNTSTSTLSNSDTLLTGCRFCFGPEIQIGYLLQEYYYDNDNADNNIPIIVVKAGWHDRSIHRDWLNGFQWYRFINTLEKTIQQLSNIIQVNDIDTKLQQHSKNKYKHPRIEYLGMVWWQGYSDMINGIYRSNYDTNLVSFFEKVRTTIQQPTLPIVVVELGISGTSNRIVPQMEYDIRSSQQSVCTLFESSNVQLVPTAYIVDQYQLHDITTTSKGNNKYFHPRNETQYYYGRADVILDISYEIGITLIELNERLLEQKKYNWFHYKGSAATTTSLMKNGAIDGTITSTSTSSSSSQQEQDAEFEQFQDTQITDSVIMVCIIIIVFVCGVVIWNYYELHYGSKSSTSRKRRTGQSKNGRSGTNNNNNNNNQLSEFVKIFRPTLSTINETDDNDEDNDNEEDDQDEKLLLSITKKLSDVELQQRAEQYGVKPQY